ncbi:MAG: hypothetical protein M3Y45_03055, partial [Actinomycetota bacterium]|nr:hypothetical protein [Actinomycetota bacterium]
MNHSQGDLMNASSTSLASGFGRAKIFALAALVVVAGVFAFANSAKAADPFEITVDNGKLNLGVLFTNKDVIPADTEGGGPMPLRPNLSPNGTISGEVDGSTVTVAKADFALPTFGVPNPTNPSQTVPIFLDPTGDLTGTWDSASGKLELTGAFTINVATGANVDPTNNPNGYPIPSMQLCTIDAGTMTFSTEPNAITPGVPFSSGLAGTGAISTTWDDLPNGVEINGGDCSTVNSIIHDVGSMWFSNGIATPPAPPACGEYETGTPPNCVPIPCPAGTTGTNEPDCVPVVKQAKITKVAIAPKKKTVKAGKK